MKYVSDGRCIVFSDNIAIAQSYLGTNGHEVRILQGCDRDRVTNKIIEDCPEFAEENNLTKNLYVKLFSTEVTKKAYLKKHPDCILT